jgi:pyrimidine operon attenuation protein/uracil phosphoribosyltransferase
VTPLPTPLIDDEAAQAGKAAEAVRDMPALMRALVQGVRAMCQSDTHLVGIATGGAWLAELLQAELKLPGEHGVLSSAMHRDDFAQRGLSAREPTRLGFDVNGAHIIVVDDVLYTGRTIRAVVNELYDYGRPASVKLAVLVERNGRELPIQADFAAVRVDLPSSRSVDLRRDAIGKLSVVVEDKS